MFFLKELPTQGMIEAYRKRFPQMNAGAVAAALELLREASRLIRELEAYFAAHDFSQLRFLILIVVDREPDAGGLTMTEIAERLDVSKPVLTRTLQSLLDVGFVRFLDNAEDGRSKLVLLTPEGRQKLDEILPGYYEIIESFMAKREKKENSH